MQVAQTEKLIEEEQRKISAYEAAFQQIKEATGVADVNEVIQRFLSQEETHQNLLTMTRESPLRGAAPRARHEAYSCTHAFVYVYVYGAWGREDAGGRPITRCACTHTSDPSYTLKVSSISSRFSPLPLNEQPDAGGMPAPLQGEEGP